MDPPSARALAGLHGRLFVHVGRVGRKGFRQGLLSAISAMRYMSRCHLLGGGSAVCFLHSGMQRSMQQCWGSARLHILSSVPAYIDCQGVTYILMLHVHTILSPAFAATR